MLMGIVTKNSILLVDYAVMAMRDRGLALREALLDACHKRARPILDDDRGHGGRDDAHRTRIRRGCELSAADGAGRDGRARHLDCAESAGRPRGVRFSSGSTKRRSVETGARLSGAV